MGIGSIFYQKKKKLDEYEIVKFVFGMGFFFVGSITGIGQYRVTHHTCLCIEDQYEIIYEFYSRTKTVIRNIFYFNILWPIYEI